MSLPIPPPLRILMLLLFPLLLCTVLVGQNDSVGTTGDPRVPTETASAITMTPVESSRTTFAEFRWIPNPGPISSLKQAQSMPLDVSAERQQSRTEARRGPAFWSLAAMATLTTVSDLEATQDCLKDRRCMEANPLMPTRRPKVYAFQIPALLSVIWGSYRLRRAGHSRLAQIPLVALIAIHTAGTFLAIRAEASR